MMIKYIDPIKTIINIFEKKYPNQECTVEFVIGMHKSSKAYGETVWNNEGTFIQIDCETPMVGVVEVLAHELAHELAHVVAGFDNGHNHVWKKEFNDIHKKYNEFMEKILGEEDEQIQH